MFELTQVTGCLLEELPAVRGTHYWVMEWYVQQIWRTKTIMWPGWALAVLPREWTIRGTSSRPSCPESMYHFWRAKLRAAGGTRSSRRQARGEVARPAAHGVSKERAHPKGRHTFQADVTSARTLRDEHWQEGSPRIQASRDLHIYAFVRPFCDDSRA